MNSQMKDSFQSENSIPIKFFLNIYINIHFAIDLKSFK